MGRETVPIQIVAPWQQEALALFEQEETKDREKHRAEDGKYILSLLAKYGLSGTPVYEEGLGVIVRVDGVAFRSGEYSTLIVTHKCPHCGQAINSWSISTQRDLGAVLAGDRWFYHDCAGALTPGEALLGALEDYMAHCGYQKSE